MGKTYVIRNLRNPAIFEQRRSELEKALGKESEICIIENDKGKALHLFLYDMNFTNGEVQRWFKDVASVAEYTKPVLAHRAYQDFKIQALEDQVKKLSSNLHELVGYKSLVEEATGSGMTVESLSAPVYDMLFGLAAIVGYDLPEAHIRTDIEQLSAYTQGIGRHIQGVKENWSTQRKGLDARLRELEAQLTTQTQASKKATDRASELEKMLAAKDAQLAAVETELRASQKALQSTTATHLQIPTTTIIPDANAELTATLLGYLVERWDDANKGIIEQQLSEMDVPIYRSKAAGVPVYQYGQLEQYGLQKLVAGLLSDVEDKNKEETSASYVQKIRAYCSPTLNPLWSYNLWDDNKPVTYPQMALALRTSFATIEKRLKVYSGESCGQQEEGGINWYQYRWGSLKGSLELDRPFRANYDVRAPQTTKV